MGVKIRHGGRHWRPPEGHCYTGVMSTESTPPDPADLDDLSRREFLGHSAKNAAVAGATAAGVVALSSSGHSGWGHVAPCSPPRSHGTRNTTAS